MKYKCIKDCAVEMYNENGFGTGEYMNIDIGSIWEQSDDNYLGAEIHLDNPDGLQWIELDNETFEECFEVVEDETD